ncbi:LysR family transcriptional regulator [Bordetella genomosp. 10]|uniref:LysR family transcriptional regulator n=1 Tax=Bordetella genomosp. 10 TaxID=1416804 RepID=A0A261SMH5_9BORD|nr:LysR substrate-binding domain-containing protein [Bordetella genomosp. 10]OZI38271.1 LysR family transcriptional regulator [Bordetella genomosp. 10]
MNLRLVDTFRQVILRGSMTAAAAHLHTSQPSVSRAVADLERSTGLTLFRRHAGRVVPTEAGMAFFREVERSFRGLDSLAQSAREIRLLGSGRLRVACIPALATTLLPIVIAEFCRRWPEAAVSLEMRSESTIARWASAAYCDVGFASLRPDAFGVRIEDLYRGAGVCAVPQAHKLARRRAMTTADLAGEQLIIPSSADVTRIQLDAILHAATSTRVPRIETPYGMTICGLVAEGLGVGIVNPLIAAYRPPAGVRFVPFEPAIVYRGYVVRPEVADENPLADRFVALARQVLAERFDHVVDVVPARA